MPLCTYYHDYEVENYKKVSDDELNELLQEVRKIDSNYYLMEKDHAQLSLWFTKPKTIKFYTVLYRTQHNEYQILNLCRNGLDISNSDSIVGAYFMGFLNGNRKSRATK